MNTPRRIAAAILTAALSLGVTGVAAGPAEAKTDTAEIHKSDSPPSIKDTTWPI